MKSLIQLLIVSLSVSCIAKEVPVPAGDPLAMSAQDFELWTVAMRDRWEEPELAEEVRATLIKRLRQGMPVSEIAIDAAIAASRNEENAAAQAAGSYYDSTCGKTIPFLETVLPFFEVDPGIKAKLHARFAKLCWHSGPDRYDLGLAHAQKAANLFDDLASENDDLHQMRNLVVQGHLHTQQKNLWKADRSFSKAIKFRCKGNTVEKYRYFRQCRVEATRGLLFVRRGDLRALVNTEVEFDVARDVGDAHSSYLIAALKEDVFSPDRERARRWRNRKLVLLWLLPWAVCIPLGIYIGYRLSAPKSFTPG